MIDIIIFSPPYAEGIGHRGKSRLTELGFGHEGKYSDDMTNIGNFNAANKYGAIDHV